MSSTEDKSLLAAAAPPPRRLKSIAAAAALLGLSFGLGAVVASSVNGNQPIVDNPCPVPLTVRGTQALVSFAPLAFKLFYAARQNAVLRRSPFPSP